jgi:hypothetical protein
MTIMQAFNNLLKNWKEHPKEYRDKYRSYRSKYLKNKKDPKAEGIGRLKMIEMLEAAGYLEIVIKIKERG